MNSLPFHIPNDEESDFYCLAWCDCRYVSSKSQTAARLAMYFSPSAGFSRFSFQCFDRETGQSHMYHRGPDYSSSAEAALLDIWVQEKLPPYTLQLIALEHCHGYRLPGHEESYLRARKELAGALYGLRMPAHLGETMRIATLIAPPEGGYTPVNAFAPDLENAELMRAFSDLKEEFGESACPTDKDET